jgi:hypothetical protein
MLVAISILRGKWSDVVLGRDVTMVLGRIESHGALMRTQIYFAKNRWVLHVAPSKYSI